MTRAARVNVILGWFVIVVVFVRISMMSALITKRNVKGVMNIHVTLLLIPMSGVGILFVTMAATQRILPVPPHPVCRIA